MQPLSYYMTHYISVNPITSSICMKKLCFCLLLLPILPVAAQVNLSQLRSTSRQTLIYKVSAADAMQFVKWDSIPVQRFIERAPDMQESSSDYFEEELPTGNYVLLDVDKTEVTARLYNASKLIVLPVNNKNQLQLYVRDKAGNAVDANEVLVKNKKAKKNKSTSTFFISYPRNEDDLPIVVFAPNDTLLTELYFKDAMYRNVPLQRRNNFRSTKLYTIIHWVPWLFRNRSKQTTTGAKGFIVFSQPKYKPLDTVKYKMYAVNKKWKQYTGEVNVYLEYYARGKYYSQLLKTLKPESPGSYNAQFILADSIPSDTRCSLNFRTRDNKLILGKSFQLEDYVLDQIGVQTFTSNNDLYFKNDSLSFTITAKDANGLNVLDARIKLALLTSRVNKFYGDSLFVKDTLFVQEKMLETTQDTKFILPAGSLPSADLSITAIAIFKNSNGEQHEKKINITYKYFSREILVKQDADTLRATYMEDGLERTAPGILAMNGEAIKAMQFPAAIKIDPIAESYTFSLEDTSVDIKMQYQVNRNYHVALNMISKHDTLGFALINPYEIPVYYTVFNGQRIIATGSSSSSLLQWQQRMPSRRQMYKVRWQYYWAGEEVMKEDNIALLYKVLNIGIDAKEKIFPGQKDSLLISITDYKGKPAANVNLTAVSYNNQFGDAANINEPPYLVKYKSRKFLERDGYEPEEQDGERLILRYPIGRFKNVVSAFNLDTMQYFKFLFPGTPFYDGLTPIKSLLPQLSVNVVKDGQPQEIYLLYINRQLVYYNGTTGNIKNAFQVFPDNIELNIRLRDKMIKIDSLYLQPYYKHDLSFDVDHLPRNATMTDVDVAWTNAEQKLLDGTMWQMEQPGNSDTIYVWQNDRLATLTNNVNHIAGPFVPNQPLQYYKPGSFDLNFTFEPGYRYRLSPKISRLEKMSLFPDKKKRYLLPEKNAGLKLGDTLTALPLIHYPEKKEIIYLVPQDGYSGYYNGTAKTGMGKLQLVMPADSIINYVVLFKKDSAGIVLRNNNGYYQNIDSGIYTIMLVTSNWYTAISPAYSIAANGINCLNMRSFPFMAKNEALSRLINNPLNRDITKKISNDSFLLRPLEIDPLLSNRLLFVKQGGFSIQGVVIDEKGKLPVANCTVIIKGSRFGVFTNESGYFSIDSLRPGKYTLQVSLVGYQTRDVEVDVSNNNAFNLQVSLEVASSELNEVVVVGYGLKVKRSFTGAAVSISGREITNSLVDNALAGKVAGVDVVSASGPGSATVVRLRGQNSLAYASGMLYVIDGILYDSDQQIDPNMIETISVLNAAAATALYGARGANGVIIITTNMKGARKDFRDYAFWIPELMTDKKGRAVAEVVYPDNATSWKTFVLGMDKKRRIGKASVLTKAYKPMMAQINTPTFFIEGDSADVITKALNYTVDEYSIETSFEMNGSLLSKRNLSLKPSDAIINPEAVKVPQTDTVSFSFDLKSTTGFKDRETREVPVLKKGTEETVGNFWVLKGDTTVQFSGKLNAPVSIYAQNNTLEMLLGQLEFLRKYPYSCMEQTASKLTGLALEKQIFERLKQPFKDQRLLDALLKKLQGAQQFDGGWAWWENGRSDFYISNYITMSLLQYRSNPLVEENLRSAFLYLNNKLPALGNKELLAALSTLSAGGHQTNYSVWIKKLPFDSLGMHQQWQLVKILQEQSLPYNDLLKQLVQKAIRSVTGAIHWGEENYKWYSNEIATTLLAYEVLSKNESYTNLLPAVIQYFLGNTSNGYWRNTVEVATIVKTILPGILASTPAFMEPAQLTISGDTNVVVRSFPFEAKFNSNGRNLSVAKTGGGLVYFTAYQQFFNSNPTPVNEKLQIDTRYESNGMPVSILKAGDKLKMIITVDAKEEAEYVMLNIPIPAGCLFTEKTNNDWRLYKSYYKNKLEIFSQQITKGKHQFEVMLEVRYSGLYTVNPAKIELMYFPVFYGRNELKQVQIIQ